MANHVLAVDDGHNATTRARDLGATYPEVWVTADIAFDSTVLTWLAGQGANIFELLELDDASFNFVDIGMHSPAKTFAAEIVGPGYDFTNFVSPVFTALQFYTVEMHATSGSPVSYHIYIDGALAGSVSTAQTVGDFGTLAIFGGGGATGGFLYFDNIKVGTTRGAADIFSDDFESGSLASWNGFAGPATAYSSIAVDPGIAPSAGGPPVATEGRVLIAFDDGPLVADPTWTRIDGGDSPFPQNFVSGYDVRVGRQTLLSQTDTGTATVYINDHELALFDPRNVSSDYYGKLDGKQIRLQLYDPVAATWEDQFRGLIDDITWDIDGSAVGADGKPINASIQIECVDMFDYLAGYGLTPGLDGVIPPAGMEDGVYYAETAGTVDDRILAILNDVGIDSTRYTVASGNIHAKAVKYDPDESALQALRDAADAELPFIANIYCDRHGKFLFRGRYSRFEPDAVSAEPGSDWDFRRWAAGDGAAIVADSNRAQLRTFSFGRNRSDLINVAICWPQDIKPADMPGQVYADTTSITAYGKHSTGPMSDLLVAGPATSGFADANSECFHYAKLLVKNQKDPRENITTLGFKSMRPDGSTRATKTWALLTRADISDTVNVAVGYPAGTGLAGASPEDEYYIEGRQLRVRPLNPAHDYVELDLNVSPAVWSMDTHSVFPPL